MSRLRGLVVGMLTWGCMAMVGVDRQRVYGESAIELLSGFDGQSVADTAAWLTQPQDDHAISQVAQLLFQLRRVGHDGLVKRLSDQNAGDQHTDDQHTDVSWRPGDVVRWTGQATAVVGVSVPDTQAEVLELPRVFRFLMQGSKRYVMTQDVPSPWLQAEAKTHTHSVSVVGIVIRTDEQGQPNVIAAPRIEWFPDEQDMVPVKGWRLLSAVGFDCGRFDDVRANDKQPLTAGEPFYELLAAAKATRSTEVAPQKVSVLELLKHSKDEMGQWVTLQVESVRVTKILLPKDSPSAQRIGQDHYWQLDTFGRVKGRVVIEPSSESAGSESAGSKQEPIEFANRYPVSLVATVLPERMVQAIDQESGPDAVVAMVRMPLSVDGFYYRQWSYDTEFVQSRDGGRQFGPLLIASRLTVRDAALPSSGIHWQWVVAGVFLVGLISIALWSWWVGRRDRQHVQRRREREMDGEFPLST